ncbi:putative cytochrome c oxidase subunit 6b-like [Cicer arietinum]|uniref:Cytochrome c oxidase subunit 6b-like n=1 Tax=Cicer arietinum TaxID=3827 RepID=A0A1S2YZ43_CICAR|nr:putative cytochrome c oxidase subunit 6b-like [Cicer arietinum]
MSGAQMDPHDKMRARDVSKVARGEQAPRPAHEFGTVSPPPPPSSTNNDKKRIEQVETTNNNVESPPINYQTRHCYAEYVQYHRCIQHKGENASECEKIGRHFRSMCPTEWITEWDKERKEGRFPDEV